MGTISKGPRGGHMLGSYHSAETFSYQDEVGQLVLQVCQVSMKRGKTFKKYGWYPKANPLSKQAHVPKQILQKSWKLFRL